MPLIRRARGQDAASLTRISFDSKPYWGYPKAYFERGASSPIPTSGDSASGWVALTRENILQIKDRTTPRLRLIIDPKEPS